MLSRPIAIRRSWTDVGYVCALISVVGFLLYLLGTVLLPFVAAGFAAYILTPIVEFFERRGLSRGWAVACLYGFFVVLISGMALFVIPTLDREIRTLHTELPRYSNEIHHALTRLHNNVEQEFPILAQFNLGERIARALVAHLTVIGERITLNAVFLFSALLLVPFLTWYLLLEGAAMKQFLISCVPNAYFESMLNLIHRIDQHLSSYLFGQVINVICISLLSAIGYSLIGVQFGIAIGILSGIVNVIPYIGALVGASVALVVSLLDESSVNKLVSIILASSVIYAFDHLVVKTVVISRTTDLHPLTIVVILVVAGDLLGLWGLLFGIPIFCIAKIVAEEIAGALQRRRLPAPTLVRSTSSSIPPPF